jgi:hypothetical protein
MKARWLSWLTLCLSSAAAQTTIPPDNGSQPGALDGGADIQRSGQYCKNCHTNAQVSIDFLDPSVWEPVPYTPVDTWVSTMMANSVRDPLFRAALTVANQDAPNVGQWCLRCHAPQSYLRGHNLPADGGALDAVDHEGVTCDICHRSVVPGNDPNAPYLSNAQIFIDRGATKYGPYDDSSSPFHPTEQSTFVSSSELCGQCHQVSNPIVPWRAADGGVLGPRFPLDTTYEEWKQSSFSRGTFASGKRSCQDCHMPAFEGSDGGIDGGSTVDGGLGYPVAKMGPYRSKPARHTFAGANVWGLDAVFAANPDLAQYAPQFAETKKWAMKNITDAAQLQLTVPATGQTGDSATVMVKVTNMTGHKLPTGYADGRRVVVQLLVDGQVLSGAFTAGGSLTPDSQLRVYEAVHGKAGVGAEEHLALHDMIVKDSRIPPAGFQVTPQTRPVGVTWFEEVDGGWRDYDLAQFTIPLAQKADGAMVNVTARLLIQTTTPEYVNFLVEENHTDDAGRTLKGIYDSIGGSPPIEMVSATGYFKVVRPSATGGGTGGGNMPGGCGCGASGPASWLLLGSVALVFWRRRTQ